MRATMQIGGWAAAIVLIALMALPCPAADSAVLRNGFSIRHERRQIIGTITRLYVSADNSSFVDIPTAEIDHFEAVPIEAAPLESALNVDSSQSKLRSPKETIQRALDLNEVVKTASGTYNLDPDLVNSVIRAESGFNVRAVSPKGAQGLMQLMPRTASELGVPNPFDPQANVEGGTKYLRELLERYNFDLVKALAAYNAGPRRVEQFGGVPPYYETRAYVARIVRDFNRKKLAQKSVATQPVAPHKSAPKASPVGSASRAATKQQTPNSSARAKWSSSKQRNE